MRTVHEGARGCGYRKGGGLYLMSDGIGMECDRLPIEMTVCPCCGHGIKPARGWTWVEPDTMLEGYIGPHGDDHHTAVCPLGAPGRLGERAGLLWIGEQHYATPEEWVAEGRKMGFSRRINAVPRGFEAGKTWVLAGHRKAIHKGFMYTETITFSNAAEAMRWSTENITDVFPDELVPVYAPGIFHVWCPARIEYVVKGDETEEELEAIEARGIEPVRVVPVEQELEMEVTA